MEDQERVEEMLDEHLCPETDLDGLVDLEEPMEALVINVRSNRLELLRPVLTTSCRYKYQTKRMRNSSLSRKRLKLNKPLSSVTSEGKNSCL